MGVNFRSSRNICIPRSNYFKELGTFQQTIAKLKHTLCELMAFEEKSRLIFIFIDYYKTYFKNTLSKSFIFSTFVLKRTQNAVSTITLPAYIWSSIHFVAVHYWAKTWNHSSKSFFNRIVLELFIVSIVRLGDSLRQLY